MWGQPSGGALVTRVIFFWQPSQIIASSLSMARRAPRGPPISGGVESRRDRLSRGTPGLLPLRMKRPGG